MSCVLYSLNNCHKCDLVKYLLSERDDIDYVMLPHNLKDWTEVDKAKVEAYDVFNDLVKTAPILVVLPSERKYIGYLQIKNALKNGEI